jgi:hypothetical protein
MRHSPHTPVLPSLALFRAIRLAEGRGAGEGRLAQPARLGLFCTFLPPGPQPSGQIGFVLHKKAWEGNAGVLECWVSRPPEIGFVLRLSPSAAKADRRNWVRFAHFAVLDPAACAHFRARRANWLCFAGSGVPSHPPEIGFVLHNRPLGAQSGSPKLGLFRAKGPGRSPACLSGAANWVCFARFASEDRPSCRLSEIGFVLPRSIECAIHHNSFPDKPLPLMSLRCELALFRTIRSAQLGLFVQLAPGKAGRPRDSPSVSNPQCCHPRLYPGAAIRQLRRRRTPVARCRSGNPQSRDRVRFCSRLPPTGYSFWLFLMSLPLSNHKS